LDVEPKERGMYPIERTKYEEEEVYGERKYEIIDGKRIVLKAMQVDIRKRANEGL
jgi:hypothetical protein